jgi:hypothetical protein
VAGLLADVWSWPAENWPAVAAWATVTIASIAGIVAARQLGETRKLRRQQAQPYVAVFMDRNSADPELVDLVLRNFGTSAATDIALKIDPPPQRAAASDAGHGDVWLPDRVPTLVPGQEWRQLWDSTPRRAEADLRDHHDAVVTFKDPQDKEHCFEYALDWGATRKRMYATTYGVHDGVKALREISKKMS